MTGYSHTPLYKKLGLSEKDTLNVVNPPGNLLDIFRNTPKSIKVIKEISKECKTMLMFEVSIADYVKDLKKHQQYLAKNGALWIAWPKRTSGYPSDLNEHIVREIGLAAGLVDVKVCAIDEIWAGLKLVYRLKDRN